MTRRALIGLLVALALVALVGWQYWPAPERAPPASAAKSAALPGLNPLAGQSSDQLTAWAAHPLFAPDRLPPEAPAPVQAEVALALEVMAPAPEPDAQPVLQGVVVTLAPGGLCLGSARRAKRVSAAGSGGAGAVAGRGVCGSCDVHDRQGRGHADFARRAKPVTGAA